MLLMLENIIYSKGRFSLWQFGTWIHLGHFSPRPRSRCIKMQRHNPLVWNHDLTSDCKDVSFSHDLLLTCFNNVRCPMRALLWLVASQESGESNQRKKWAPWAFCPQGFARLDRLEHALLCGKIQPSVNQFTWIKSLGFWGEQQNTACCRWLNCATYLVVAGESVRYDVTMWTSSCWWNIMCEFDASVIVLSYYSNHNCK